MTEVGSSPILATGQSEAIKFLVKVRIENPPPGIKPGLSVQAEQFITVVQLRSLGSAEIGSPRQKVFTVIRTRNIQG